MTMAIDASIYSLLQPQQKAQGPLESYGQAMTIRNLMGQGQLQDLQRGELERGITENRQLRDLFRSGGKVTPEQVMAINPTTGMAYQKNVLDNQKTEAELRSKRMETLAKGVGILKDRLPTVRDEDSYRAYVEHAKQLLGPDQVGQLGLPPSFDPMWVQRQLVESKELFTPKPQVVEMPDGSKQTIDMNPFTNPQAVNFKAPAAMKPAEVAQLNKPTWDSDRGMWISPPRVGPTAAPAPRAPFAAPSAPAGAPAAPATPVAPAATPVPGIEPRPKLTAGQEALDREFAKELAAFQTGGGADQAKQLAQLGDVVKALGGAKDEKTGKPIKGENVTGNWQGLMNTLGLSGVVTPRSAAVRERVEEVVQRSLRAILGAQFTEKEGERLIARAYNPYLDEKENLVRVSRLFKQLDSAMKSKADAAAHFEKNGTLTGWKGKLPSIADFDPGPEVSAPKAATKGGAKSGGIRFLGYEEPSQ